MSEGWTDEYRRRVERGLRELPDGHSIAIAEDGTCTYHPLGDIECCPEKDTRIAALEARVRHQYRALSDAQSVLVGDDLGCGSAFAALRRIVDRGLGTTPETPSTGPTRCRREVNG